MRLWRVTVEWHEVSAAAADRVRGGGGSEYAGWTSQRVITGAPRQPAVLRRRGGGQQGREAPTAVVPPPPQWLVVCPRRPRNRSASTRRSKNSCGATRGTPGESSSFCCSVSTARHSTSVLGGNTLPKVPKTVHFRCGNPTGLRRVYSSIVRTKWVRPVVSDSPGG